MLMLLSVEADATTYPIPSVSVIIEKDKGRIEELVEKKKEEKKIPKEKKDKKGSFTVFSPELNEVTKQHIKIQFHFHTIHTPYVHTEGIVVIKLKPHD